MWLAYHFCDGFDGHFVAFGAEAADEGGGCAGDVGCVAEFFAGMWVADVQLDDGNAQIFEGIADG